MKVPRFNPKKAHREIEEWLQDPKWDRLWQKWATELEELLPSTSRGSGFIGRFFAKPKETLTADNVSYLGSKLFALSSRWNNRFLHAAYDGNAMEAAVNGRNMLDYEYYHIRILSKAAELGKARVFYPDIHRCFVLQLAFGRWEEAYRLGKTIFEHPGDYGIVQNQESVGYWRKVSEDEALGDGPHSYVKSEPFCSWTDTPFCGFVLRLWLEMDKGESGHEVPALPACGVYEGLFDRSDDPNVFRDAISAACDYHLVRSSQTGVVEFSLRPYSLLPIEVMAIFQLRGISGKPSSLPEQPLLDSPFFRGLPSELSEGRDELLERVVHAARTVLPDL